MRRRAWVWAGAGRAEKKSAEKRQSDAKVRGTTKRPPALRMRIKYFIPWSIIGLCPRLRKNASVIVEMRFPRFVSLLRPSVLWSATRKLSESAVRRPTFRKPRNVGHPHFIHCRQRFELT